MLKLQKKYDPGKRSCPIEEKQLADFGVTAFNVPQDKREFFDVFVKVALASERPLRAESCRVRTMEICMGAAEAGFADMTVDLRTDTDRAWEKKMRTTK